MIRSFTLSLLLLIVSSPVFAAWTPIANISAGPTTACFSWVIGNRVFVSGGTNSLQLWEYNTTTDQWTAAGNMGGNMYHTFAYAFVANGKGYAIGGDTATGTPGVGIWEYDPAGGTWTNKGVFPGGGRKQGFCFVINNIAYLGAGNDGVDNKDDFWKYDPATNQWTNMGTAPMGPVHYTSSFVINNKGYVCGGEVQMPGLGFETQNALWEYDPAANKWTPKKDAPDDRVGGTGFTVSGFGYLAGGYKDANVSAKEMWNYDPASDKWSVAETLPNAYTVFTTSFVKDTTYYIGAGIDISKGTPAKTDAFYRHGAKPAGINKPGEIAAFTMFPNPVKNVITVSSGNPILQITICDATGRIMLNDTEPSLLKTISVNEYMPGTYFIRCIINKETITQRFIKE